MVRGRLPGGVVQPTIYLAFDQARRQYGNNTLRITTRQGFQFHGVVKSGLGKFMRGINDAMATTLAACGDVNRNVMAPPTPATSAVRRSKFRSMQSKFPMRCCRRRRAYHQIWVEGVELESDRRRSRISSIRFMAKLICRENSKWRSPFRR